MSAPCNFPWYRRDASGPITPKWTIQVTWTERDDEGKSFRARSVIHVNAWSLPEAYTEGDKIKELKPTAVLGAIVQGHHWRL